MRTAVHPSCFETARFARLLSMRGITILGIREERGTTG
jgi:hypothetical protein